MLCTVLKDQSYGANLVNRLSDRLNVSAPLIYKWQSGDLPMSPDVLPVLYDLAKKDARVYQMLMPDNLIALEKPTATSLPAVHGALAESISSGADAQRVVLAALADGHIHDWELPDIEAAATKAAARDIQMAQVCRNLMINGMRCGTQPQLALA